MSAAAIGFGAFARALPVLAGDVIGNAKIIPSGEMVPGSKYKKDGPVRIGFSNGFSGNTWRTECLYSVKMEASRHPEIADFIVVDGQGDIAKQVNDIENLVSQNVDAILCIPNSGSAVAPALRDATKQGIITIPFNLPVDGEAWTAYNGTDPQNKGFQLGKWLRGAIGKAGKIVALGGLPGNSYTAAAWAGAQKAMEGSQIEILAFRDAYWEEDRAKVVMADLIAAYPQVDGVWCDGSQDAAGAMKALLDAKRPLVPVTGDDYNGLLKLYDQHAAAEPKFQIGLLSEPTWESVIALRTALKLLKGEDVPKRQVIQPQLITSQNYKNYVRPELPDGVFIDTDLTSEELKKLFKS
ncbi:MAG: substrate-binding domain-containing protein [Verrucomicrobia bacterium]|nr:substrate-binding domain-containing protein [Verrucomicrobiota bacterium]